jgi:uroporphyrin-III C-methyltransferase
VVHVGKRGGCASTPQAFIHRLMVAEARAANAWCA